MRIDFILVETVDISKDSDFWGGAKFWASPNINLQFDQKALDNLLAFCESDARNEPIKNGTRSVSVTPEMFERRLDAVPAFLKEYLNSIGFTQHENTPEETGMMDSRNSAETKSIPDTHLGDKPQPKTQVKITTSGNHWWIQAANQEVYDWIKENAGAYGVLYPHEDYHLTLTLDLNLNFDAGEVQVYLENMGESPASDSDTAAKTIKHWDGKSGLHTISVSWQEPPAP